MSTEHRIHVIFFVKRHELATEIKEKGCSLRPARLLAKGVHEDIPMLQHDFPPRLTLGQILLQPSKLVGQQIRLPALRFMKIGIQHCKMHGAIIKAIKLTLVLRQTIFRHSEEIHIALRRRHFPL